MYVKLKWEMHVVYQKVTQKLVHIVFMSTNFSTLARIHAPTAFVYSSLCPPIDTWNSPSSLASSQRSMVPSGEKVAKIQQDS